MIYVTGDFHGNAKQLSSKNFPEGKDLTKDDLVIQLGDFGMYFGRGEDKEAEYWLKWISEKPFTFAFIRGNHDNKDLIEENIVTVNKWGNEVGRITKETAPGVYNDIYYLKAGVYTIQDKKILVIPGATSHDKHLRTEHIDWWSNETLSRQETEKILDDLDKVNWKVDYVLGHTCPQSVAYQFYDGPPNHCQVSQFMDYIDERLEFKEWHMGHFHNERVFQCCDESELYRCHYKETKELK